MIGFGDVALSAASRFKIDKVREREGHIYIIRKREVVGPVVVQVDRLEL